MCQAVLQDLKPIIDGVMRIQDLIGKESLRRRNGDRYKNLLESYGIQ
jgi:NADH-quinone oxidoreductase subunit B